ncbi:MAG: Type II secretion system protein C [Pseudidiomarina mangrovi]|nr:MAG: Type II secretion system protein C [Pseudidiomarina mangrovi]
MQGYRLQAKNNPEIFTAAGFQNGDLAIAINGQSLTDMNTAMALTRSLGTMTNITVTVLRQGKTIDLELAIPATLPGN